MRYKHNSIIASVNIALLRLPRSTLCKYSSACRNELATEFSTEDEECADGDERLVNLTV